MVMSTFVLTYNPARWNWDDEGRQDEVDMTQAGQVVQARWSTGGRRGGIFPGDTAVLFQQGTKGRGLVAYGTFTSPIYTGEHWDGSGRDANYAAVDWQIVLPAEDMIPIEEVKEAVRTVNWDTILGSGIVVPPPGDQALDALWDGLRSGSGTARWQPDPARRRRVEEYAQARLERHFWEQGWQVRDTHLGNPYDALATKGVETKYLEAKGTEGDGKAVLVTPGEVEHARQHPGECVLGIVKRVRLRADGTVEPGSGELVLHDWKPDEGKLKVTGYEWSSS
jgi:hypothetical protein